MRLPKRCARPVRSAATSSGVAVGSARSMRSLGGGGGGRAGGCAGEHPPSIAIRGSAYVSELTRPATGSPRRAAPRTVEQVARALFAEVPASPARRGKTPCSVKVSPRGRRLLRRTPLPSPRPRCVRRRGTSRTCRRCASFGRDGRGTRPHMCRPGRLERQPRLLSSRPPTPERSSSYSTLAGGRRNHTALGRGIGPGGERRAQGRPSYTRSMANVACLGGSGGHLVSPSFCRGVVGGEIVAEAIEPALPRHPPVCDPALSAVRKRRPGSRPARPAHGRPSPTGREPLDSSTARCWRHCRRASISRGCASSLTDAGPTTQLLDGRPRAGSGSGEAHGTAGRTVA